MTKEEFLKEITDSKDYYSVIDLMELARSVEDDTDIRDKGLTYLCELEGLEDDFLAYLEELTEEK